MFGAFLKFGRMGAGANVPWSPTTLFAAGEQGGVWDFTNLSNLYQDSEGTTPVTAVGDPIGLVLDTKNGTPKLGPIINPNPGNPFTSTSGYTGDGSTLTVADGVLTSTNASASFPSLLIDFYSLTPGKTYTCTFDITANTGSLHVSASLGGTWDTIVVGARTIPAGAGGQISIIAAPTGTSLRFRLYGSVAGSFSVSQVSVRELPGNHLSQSSSTKRPILGRMPATGVRNLLTYSEDFSNSAIDKTNITASGLSIRETATTAAHRLAFGAGGNVSIQAGTYVTFKVKVTDEGRSYVGINPDISTGGFGFTAYAWFNLATGTVSFIGSALVSAAISQIGGSWELSVVALSETTATGYAAISLSDSEITSPTAYPSYLGDVSKGIKIENAQLELGATATAYQKVGAAYDITESGVASVYTAYFDGTDDALVSQSIDLTGTDAMSVFAGIRKTSDAARGMVTELSATTDSNNGSFALTAPNAASATVAFESKGTALTDSVGTSTAPANVVISATAKISTDANVLRLNGAQADSDTGDQGTGNYGNYAIYVGQRGAASLPYKGFLTALCVRGAATDAAIVTSMEKWMASKTPGVSL